VVCSKLCPQPRDKHLDRVLAQSVAFWPYFASDYLSTDSPLLHCLGEQMEQAVFVAGEVKTPAIKPGTLPLQIDLERAEDETVRTRSQSAPDSRTQTRGHFFGMDRLDQEIVGSCLEAGNALAPVVSRRKHDQRQVYAATPHFADQELSRSGFRPLIEQDCDRACEQISLKVRRHRRHDFRAEAGCTQALRECFRARAS